MRRSLFLVAAVAAALVHVTLVRAEDEQETAWQAEFDRLLDRFQDVQGSRADLARRLIEKRLQEKPDDARARLELARMKVARGDHEGAILEANKATVAKGDVEKQAEAVRVLATYHRNLQRLEKVPDEARKQALEDVRKLTVESQDRLLRVAGSEAAAKALLAQEGDRRERLLELPDLGRAAPPIGRQDVAGKAIDLADHRGQPVLVVFFNATDRNAAAELPNVAKVVKDLKASGLVAFGVSLDERREDLDRVVKAHGLELRLAHETDGLRSQVALAWNVTPPLPSTYLVDHDGKIRYVNVKAHGEGLAAAAKKLCERAEAARKKG